MGTSLATKAEPVALPLRIGVLYRFIILLPLLSIELRVFLRDGYTLPLLQSPTTSRLGLLPLEFNPVSLIIIYPVYSFLLI